MVSLSIPVTKSKGCDRQITHFAANLLFQVRLEHSRACYQVIWLMYTGHLS
jgi:hypothetical protein